MKRILVILERAPYGTVIPAEAFRLAIGLAGIEYEITFLLAGDGVFCARAGQKPEGLAMKSLGQALDSLDEFDVKLYAFDRSLGERGLARDQLIDNLEVVDFDGYRRLVAEADGVVSF